MSMPYTKPVVIVILFLLGFNSIAVLAYTTEIETGLILVVMNSDLLNNLILQNKSWGGVTDIVSELNNVF